MAFSNGHRLDNIYKERCLAYYENWHFEKKLTFESVVKESIRNYQRGRVDLDEKMEFPQLTLEYAEAISDLLTLQA